MSYRKLFLPPSRGVALQGLFHWVLCFETIIETHFDFTPQLCNTTAAPIAYHAATVSLMLADILVGRWNTNPGFILGGRMVLLMLRCQSFENFVSPLLRWHWSLISFCLWWFFSSPFVESASLPFHPIILIYFMHVLRTFLVGHGFWRLVF